MHRGRRGRHWRRNTRAFVIGITVATVIATAIISEVERRSGGHGQEAPTATMVVTPTPRLPTR
jgi:hypothetical protein